MEFIETPTFVRQIDALLNDAEYLHLQASLMTNPERGDIIRGGGGIRKMRFAAQGHGKRGGVRIVYYWVNHRHQIYLLAACAKSKVDDLSIQEVAALRDFVKNSSYGKVIV